MRELAGPVRQPRKGGEISAQRAGRWAAQRAGLGRGNWAGARRKNGPVARLGRGGKGEGKLGALLLGLPGRNRREEKDLLLLLFFFLLKPFQNNLKISLKIF